MRRGGLFVAVTALGLVPMSAFAQVPPSLSALCPKAKPGEILVCADADPLRSPYRLPLPSVPDPDDPRNASVSRERNGLFDYDGGGIGSCSASGAGGQSGCGFQRHKRWVEQRAGARDPRGRLWDAQPR